MNPGFRQQLDLFLERLLFITPNQATKLIQVTRGFNLALFISALRCILQYVLFPFLLPFVGIASGSSALLGLVLNAIAFVSLISSLRRVFGTQHPRRFSYLPLAILMIFVVIVFTISDIRALGENI